MIKRALFFIGFFFLSTPLTFASPALSSGQPSYPDNFGQVRLGDIHIYEDFFRPQILGGTAIAIIIPDSAPMTWEIENRNIRFNGTFANRVSNQISYKNNGKSIVIPVLTTLESDTDLAIEGLQVRLYGQPATFQMQLDFTGDGLPDVSDQDDFVITDSPYRDMLAPYAPQNVLSSLQDNRIEVRWDRPVDVDIREVVIAKRDGNGNLIDMFYDVDPYDAVLYDLSFSEGGASRYDIYFSDNAGNKSQTVSTYIFPSSANTNANATSNSNTNLNYNINNNASCSCFCTAQSCSSCCKYLYTFNDMPTLFWAHDFGEFMYQEGIFEGVWKNGVRLFEPERTINRAEMAKVAVVALNKGNTSYPSGQPYYDVPLSSWYYPYVSIAKQLHLVLSIGNYFYPDKLVTRAEALQTLFVIGDVAIDSSLSTNQFKDVYAGNPYMKYIAYAYNKGIINGYSDGTFRPFNYINRAEIAKILTLLLNLCSSTFKVARP